MVSRFNVLYSNKDVNFERIAHLVKLVFNTKMVLISLVDEKNQWHKAEGDFSGFSLYLMLTVHSWSECATR